MKKTLNAIVAVAMLLTFASHASAQWAPVETFDVNSLNVPIVTSTTSLDNGRWYRFEVSGTWDATAPAETILCDAEYVTYDNWTTHLDILLAPNDGPGEGLCELMVNGTIVEWGAYNPSHIYTMDFIGNGSTVDFQIFDTFPSNNAGVLTVQISEGIATIDKTMQSEAGLGDHVTITLQVDNPYDPNIIVKDILPDCLKYIPETLTDNNDIAVPLITDDGIELEVGPGEHTIVFDVQVVKVSDANVLCTNIAVVYNDSDTQDANDIAEIILRPYAGLSKDVVEWDDLSGEWVVVEPPYAEVPLHTDVTWYLLITVEDVVDDEVDMDDIVVKDNLAGDLELHSINSVNVETPPEKAKKRDSEVVEENVTIQWSGNSQKVHLSWDVTAAGGPDAALILEISTDYNPGQRNKGPGKNEYTSIGEHDLNSGATLKFTDPETGLQLSAHTGSITVIAYDPDDPG